MYKKTSLNSFASLARFVLCTIIWLLLTKYLVHKLGMERFGLWSLLGLITVYGGLVDLGVTQALVRYVAEFYARQDYAKIGRYVTISLLLYFFISLVVCITLWFGRRWLVSNILRLDKRYWDISQVVIILSGISIGVSMFGGIFRSTLEGTQKIVISNLIILIQTVMIAGGSYFFLEKNMGLIGLAVNNLIVYTLSSILFLYASKIFLKPMKISAFGLDWKEVTSLLRYGLSIQSSSIMGIGFHVFNKIFITRYLSVTYAGFFEISIRVLDALKGVFVSFILPIFPLSSAINISKGKNEVAKLTSFVNTLILTLSLPSFVLMYIFLPQIFKIWLGNFNQDLIWSTRLILIPFFCSTLISAIYIVFQGIGLARWNASLHLMNLLLGIPVIYIAVKTGSYFNFVLMYSLITTLPSIVIIVMYKIFFSKMPLYKFTHIFQLVFQQFSQIKIAGDKRKW